MSKSFSRAIVNKIRKLLPLSFRIAFGPFVGYCVYIFNVYIRNDKNRPKVLPIKETIDLINREKLSVIRFGDGEMTLIEGADIGFQQVDRELADKLKMVLQSDRRGLLICIPGIWGKLNAFTKNSFWFATHHLFRYDHVWRSLLLKQKVYGDAHITRPYLAFEDKSGSAEIFNKLFSIWQGQEVVLIEGKNSLLGVGNDMFGKVKSLQRILCPPKSAYNKYELIKKEALKIDKASLVLLSLGPTAKVLAYELFLAGYRVIDVGHIDMEYEMYLRKQPSLTKVRYKYFNEINEIEPEEYAAPEYLQQIIATIQ